MNKYDDLLPNDDASAPNHDETPETPEIDEVLSSSGNVGDASSPALRWKQFPVEAFPEPLNSYVRSVARSIGCDPAYVAVPLLSVVAAAIGSTRRIRLKPGWTEPCAIWTAIIGESGSQKSPALRQVVQPLKRFQTEQLAIWQREYQQYETAKKIYEVEFAEWKQDRRRQKLTDEPPPEAPEAPIQIRYIVNDVTVESLAPILNQNPHGLLVYRDELSGWIGSFDKYSGGKGSDASHWLSMFNGESITVDRKTTNPPTIHVPEALVSVTGSIQPAIFWKALGDEHRQNGLAARLLLCHPPQRAKKWTETGVSEQVEESLQRLIGALLELPLDETSHPGIPTAFILDLDDDARSIWAQYYDVHAEAMAEKTGEVSAAYSKLEGYTARFAMVFQVVRALHDSERASHTEVDRDSLLRSITLARWFAHEAERLYSRRSQSEDDRRRDQLLEFAIQKGRPFTVRDVARTPLMKFFNTSEDIERALHGLCRQGLLTRQTSQPDANGGRPSDQFSLVDEHQPP